MSNDLIQVIIKHLPPSASSLRLLDVNGEVGRALLKLRADLAIEAVSGQASQWQVADSSVDAIVACNYVLNDAFLTVALRSLRPGGRLIIANSRGTVTAEIGRRLEATGYVRILVEAILEDGILLRGEKPHTTADTLLRIQQTAEYDANQLTLQQYKGRYIHLLICQTPNKPVWRLEPDEVIRWQVVGIRRGNQTMLLAFSSLPKAVALMQPAVLAGKIVNVNKVAKFDKALNWELPVLLNPTLNDIEHEQIVLIDIDPDLAELPDE
ncbi:MAG: hypothetical protein CUN56_05915 [Phototrophicales bacterium]|nr:MAG: hypothetical protein CUN56_05915 [Phototrophicales bacterium]RMG77809.1 MAG: hypothetical protein D6711_00525 [Chloroflexota bacterium]